MKMYKIRNKDGLFSTGGMSPRFTKIGKTWTRLQYVNSHLNQLYSWHGYDCYEKCELVIYECEEISSLSLVDHKITVYY